MGEHLVGSLQFMGGAKALFRMWEDNQIRAKKSPGEPGLGFNF
jgi:hypothetical protein